MKESMPKPSRLRDSTQIVLPMVVLDGMKRELQREYQVTIFEEGDGIARVIGSPVEIKAVSDFLTSRGIALP